MILSDMSQRSAETEVKRNRVLVRSQAARFLYRFTENYVTI
jgi:hypothetical protein